MARFDCPHCHATLHAALDVASVVVEQLPPVEVSVGERGLCGVLDGPGVAGMIGD